MDTQWSRRSFLSQLVGAGMAPWVLSACSAEDGNGDVTTVGFTFDLHTHPGVFFLRGLPAYGGDVGFTARVDDMATRGMTAAFFSLVSDTKILERTEAGIRVARAFESGEAWADYQRQLAQFRELMAMGKGRAVTDLRGTDAAKEQHEVAALLAVEGGDFLEGDVDRVPLAYEDGVRSIQLVHYAQNDLGDLQTEPPVYDGLSAFGLEVVDQMVELGMVIDVAHASFTTVGAVAERAGVPIILSHSLLNTPQRSHPRHIDEDHARLIAETGGVIGMWPSGFGSETLEEFVDHTMRMIDVVGVDHVGLGSDMDSNYRPVITNYSDYVSWVRSLGNRGMTPSDIEKVTGGNARRVLEAVL